MVIVKKNQVMAILMVIGKFFRALPISASSNPSSLLALFQWLYHTKWVISIKLGLINPSMTRNRSNRIGSDRYMYNNNRIKNEQINN